MLRNKSTLEFHMRPETTIEQRNRILHQWYRKRLKELIPPLIQKWQTVLGVEVADWGIRKMKTRWGTCNHEARRIWLNLELAHKPVQCLEYIIAHEMVHLIERYHNDRFITLMGQYLPQWRLQRTILNSFPVSHEHWKY